MSEGELLTRRLRLRPVSASDLDAIADLNADPEVMWTIARRPSTRAESAAWLERHLDYRAESGGLGAWRLDELGGGSFVGRAVFRPLGDEVELGYALHRAFWGLGYATEAGRALVDHGFGGRGLDRVVALTVPDNPASQRVLVKLGFTRRGEVISHGELCPFFDIDRVAWMTSAHQFGVLARPIGCRQLPAHRREADDAALVVRGSCGRKCRGGNRWGRAMTTYAVSGAGSEAVPAYRRIARLVTSA